MKSISEIFCEYKKTKEQKRIDRIEKRASEIFQITEYDGRLWFTYDSFLYCPCAMIGDEPVKALSTLREQYIQRKTKE